MEVYQWRMMCSMHCSEDAYIKASLIVLRGKKRGEETEREALIHTHEQY